MKHLLLCAKRMAILMIVSCNNSMRASAFLHQPPRQVGTCQTKSTTKGYTSFNMSTTRDGADDNNKSKNKDVYAQAFVGETKLNDPQKYSCLGSSAVETPSDLVKEVKECHESDAFQYLVWGEEDGAKDYPHIHSTGPFSLLHCEASIMSVYPPGTPVPPPPGVEPLPKDEPLTQETDVDNPFIVVAPEVTDDNRLLENKYFQWRMKYVRTITDLANAYTDLAKKHKNLRRQFYGYVIDGNESIDIDCLPEEWMDNDKVLDALYQMYGYEEAPLKLQAHAKFYERCYENYLGQNYARYHMNWEDKIPDLAKQNVEIVMLALDYKYGGIKKWDEIPKEVQMVPRVAWRARNRGLVKMKDLEYLLCPEALKVGLESGEAEWRDVPESFQKDIDFIKSLTKFTLSEAWYMLEAHPELGGEASFWYALQRYHEERWRWWLRYFSDDNIDVLVDLLRTYGTHGDLLSNTDFWKNLLFSGSDKFFHVSKIKKVLEVADRSIWHEKDFVSHILDRDFSCMKDFNIVLVISHENQVEHVDLIKKMIMKSKSSKIFAQTSYNDYVELATNLAPKLWQDRSVLQAWFKDAGNPFIPEIHGFLSTDREVFLWIVEHCTWTRSFGKADSTLLQDRSFVKKALALNQGNIFRDFFQLGHWEDETEYELYFFAYGIWYHHKKYVQDFMKRKQATKDEFLAHIEELEKDVIVRLSVDLENNDTRTSDNVDAVTTDGNEMLHLAVKGLQAVREFITESEEDNQA